MSKNVFIGITFHYTYLGKLSLLSIYLPIIFETKLQVLKLSIVIIIIITIYGQKYKFIRHW